MTAPRRDDGFTLVEMLVAITLFGLLGSVLTSMLVATRNSALATQQQHDINQEARQGLNRLTRELRQAQGVRDARNVSGTGYNSSAVSYITFDADFNGSGCIAGATGCADVVDNVNAPEIVTYCYDPALLQVFVIAGALASASCSGGTQVLSGQVRRFQLGLQSNLYLYDADGDGVTTWEELDAAPAPTGNSSGSLDSNELRNIDSIVVDMQVREGVHAQSYRTQVDLRNLSCNTAQVNTGSTTC